VNLFRKIILFIWVTVSLVCSSQISKKADELYYKGKKMDSLTRQSKLLEIKNEVKNLEDKHFYKLAEAAVLNAENKFKESVALYYEAINIAEELKNDSLKGLAFGKLGSAYFVKDILPKALININQAIKLIPEHKTDSIYVQLHVKKAIIFSYLSLTKDYKTTSDWLVSAANQQPSRILEANIYNTVGNCFLEMNEPDSAIYYFEKSRAIREEIQNLPWIGQSYNNMGTAYFIQNRFSAALKYFQQGLMWRIKGNSAFGGVGESYINIGKTYYKLGNTSLANLYLTKAYSMADSVGHLKLKYLAAEVLKEVYKEKGDYKKAMEYQDLYYAANDSMYSGKKKEELTNLALDFDTDQKLRQDSTKRVQAELAVMFEQEKHEAISKRTNIIIMLLILFLSVVAFFAYSFFKSNQQKQKQNELITDQHHLLQEKQTEINDSINYAKNIQNALLPSAGIFKEKCTEHFIFFQPKDVVSGDFYWASEVKDGKDDLFIYIIADCTGHGVPGAFMSLISISFFNEIINEEKITDPAKILNTLRKRIIQTLNQKESGHRQDGLDCVVCVLNKKTNELSYAGANNKLYVASSYGDYVVTEYKTDKMPVGKSPHENIPFTKHTLQLKDKDIIYTFTDGYPDQFGGPTNKKLKTKNVQKKIASMVEKPLSEQKKELELFFEEWKGNNEQIDDVTFIAIKV
jgi:serine phosphatase RsbU (regulator of sigma subunit)